MIDDGSLERVSYHRLVEHIDFLVHRVRRILDLALLCRVLSRNTAIFIYNDFEGICLNYRNDDELYELVLKYAARLRFLVKFHKQPVAYRQIENDSRSVVTGLAKVCGRFLNTVQIKIKTCIRDSRAVLCAYDKTNIQIPSFKFRYKPLLFSADVRDFFNQIDLVDLIVALDAAIDAFVDSINVAKFIRDSVAILLKSKFIMIKKQLFRKRRSLSIGEYIATACASICTWHWFDKPLLKFLENREIHVF